MPLPLMLDHQETQVRTSKVLTKIRNGQVARFCAIGHYLPFAVDWAAKMGCATSLIPSIRRCRLE